MMSLHHSLQDEAHIQYNMANKRLCNFYQEFQEQECSQQTKQAWDDISACREGTPVQDPAKGYRTEPQDAVQALMRNDEIWSKRFHIAKTYDEKKAVCLVAEFANRTLDELEEFLQTYDRKTISQWEKIYIYDPLLYAIQHRRS